MTNPMDVIELLERDHRRIDALAEELEAADDPAECRRLFLTIVEELAAHEAAEQQVLFPAFRALVEAPDDSILAHRLGEHEELNDLLAEMRSLAPKGFGFTKRGSALMLDVKAHFLAEEETVFVRMREALCDADLAALGTRALEAKRLSPAFPNEHPRLADH
ncbi:MAG: hemerythrin domain-containing protein [Ilumatobacteraceae bacterium]